MTDLFGHDHVAAFARIGKLGRKHAVWRITERGWAKHLELAASDLAAAT